MQSYDFKGDQFVLQKSNNILYIADCVYTDENYYQNLPFKIIEINLHFSLFCHDIEERTSEI